MNHYHELLDIDARDAEWCASSRGIHRRTTATRVVSGRSPTLPAHACRSDKTAQTVPDASSGNRKSSVTDGRQSGAADNQ